ncbi:hypothetical protein KEM52_003745, partial [Ascosphaera acerosa]
HQAGNRNDDDDDDGDGDGDNINDDHPQRTSAPPSPSRNLTRAEIKLIIEGTACIGVVSREGKDAAGQPLESEYYYVPDADGDDLRRTAVMSQLMKPGLRSCRKQHKVSAVGCSCLINLSSGWWPRRQVR